MAGVAWACSRRRMERMVLSNSGEIRLGDVVVSSRQVVQALGAGLQVAPHHLWNQASERPRAEQMCLTGRPARRRLMAR